MNSRFNEVVYIKPSLQGSGNIPEGAIGKVLIYCKHPITTKLLVDFYSYGKAVVPLSSVKRVEE